MQLSIVAFQARVDEILASEVRSAGDEVRSETFARIHHEDLFLALACADEDRVAWEHFAEDYLPLLRHFATQFCGNPGEGEDLAQEIANRLLEEKGCLAGYNGRGSLAGWLRVTVLHAAIDRFRRTGRQTSLESLEERGAVLPLNNVGDQDEESLDSRWGPVISVIAQECLRRLSARDRLILCLYYLHAVSLKDIGRQFEIHEATASRRLDRLRREIRKEVERELRKKHRLRSSEIQSLWERVSPRSFAQSIDPSSPTKETPLPDASGRVGGKPAISENAGVIEKEELR